MQTENQKLTDKLTAVGVIGAGINAIGECLIEQPEKLISEGLGCALIALSDRLDQLHNDLDAIINADNSKPQSEDI